MREQWQDRWEDLYRILQVDFSAEPEVIKAAYARLAQKYHPDKNKSPDAGERMRKINEAYEVLGDAARRARYDQEYQNRMKSSAGAGVAGHRESRAGARDNHSTGSKGSRNQGSEGREQRQNQGARSGPWSQKRDEHYSHATMTPGAGQFIFEADDPDITAIRGVFSARSWAWEVAGLIVTMMSAAALSIFAVAMQPAGLIALYPMGVAALTAAVYCAYRTDWLRKAKRESEPLRSLAAACVIVGWLSPAAISIYLMVSLLRF